MIEVTFRKVRDYFVEFLVNGRIVYAIGISRLYEINVEENLDEYFLWIANPEKRIALQRAALVAHDMLLDGELV